jgi:hypothetical protein
MSSIVSVYINLVLMVYAQRPNTYIISDILANPTKQRYPETDPVVIAWVNEKCHQKIDQSCNLKPVFYQN